METKSYKNRWFLTVNGIIALLFGLLLFIFPKNIITSVVFLSGLAITLAGLCFLFIAINHMKKDRNVGMLILQSIFSLAIGLGIMIFHDETLHLFFLLFGVWAIIVGIFQLVILVNIKRNLSNKNFLLFNGLLTIALGIVMIVEKDVVGIFLTKVLGAFAILFGIVMIYLSFIIRKTVMIKDNETDSPAR
ncbi:MAG: DUF308 domain-containing protein [Bacteroidales bacterium]|jgi:uncharacterized membrane protein HdeD (DUF308 family)